MSTKNFQSFTDRGVTTLLISYKYCFLAVVSRQYGGFGLHHSCSLSTHYPVSNGHMPAGGRGEREREREREREMTLISTDLHGAQSCSVLRQQFYCLLNMLWILHSAPFSPHDRWVSTLKILDLNKQPTASDEQLSTTFRSTQLRTEIVKLFAVCRGLVNSSIRCGTVACRGALECSLYCHFFFPQVS